jgi:hypothetical protein
MITQLLKHNAEMLIMLFLTLRKDQDVVNEDYDKLIQLFHKNRVHQVHEVSGGVGQTKAPDTHRDRIEWRKQSSRYLIHRS